MRKHNLCKFISLFFIFLIISSSGILDCKSLLLDSEEKISSQSSTLNQKILEESIAQSGNSVELIIGTNTKNYDALSSIIIENGGQVINTISMDGLMAIVVNISSNTASSFAGKIRDSGYSQYLESNIKSKVLESIPNDPYWSDQWGPKKIQADYAWNTTIGSKTILVAVIDSGIDYTHPDLAANYVSLGYDWFNNDSDPKDDCGHGTHCAGIIAAQFNNSIGVTGIAQVRLMAEKVVNGSGYGTPSLVSQGIIDAVDKGANILSLSLGFPYSSSVLQNAITYADTHGVLVFASAGNDGTNNPNYPAAYDSVVAVTATDSADQSASFTSYGDWVDVAAPGVNIYSTMPTYHVALNDEGISMNYGYMDGTSMACPFAAGVAALIWSRNQSMNAKLVRYQLQATCDDLGTTGFDKYYGNGRINAKRAVEQAIPNHDVLVLNWQTPEQLIKLGNQATFNATVLNGGLMNENNVQLQLMINNTVFNSTTISSLQSGASANCTFSWLPTTAGTYNITFYIVPVPGESIVGNNAVTKNFNVKLVVISVALISDNSELSSITSLLDSIGMNYDVYTNNRYNLYTEDFTLLNTYPIVIFCNNDRAITSNEQTALNSYLSASGNLIVTGVDSLGHPNDPLLANVVRSLSVGDNTGEPNLYVVNASHPIMNGPYGNFSAGYHISGLSGDNDAASADTSRNAVTVANLGDGYDKIIATDSIPGKVVYWNGPGQSDWSNNVDCKNMFYNILAWFNSSLLVYSRAIYDGLWHTSDFTIDLSATGNNGIAATYYKVNGGGIQSVSVNGQPRITTESSNNKLEYWSVDTLGNAENHKILTQIKLDKTAPLGSIRFNNGATSTNSTSITLNLDASDSTSSINGVRFSNDGITWSSWEAFRSSRSYTLTSGQGTKTVYYQIKNNAGLISSYNSSITFDTTPPIANAGPSTTTAVVGQGVAFNAASSSDNIGVVSYYWDFGDRTNGTGGSITHVYSTKGSYLVTLTVRDAAGNTGVSTMTVIVQTQLEAIQLYIYFIAIAAFVAAIVVTAIVLRKRRRKDYPLPPPPPPPPPTFHN